MGDQRLPPDFQVALDAYHSAIRAMSNGDAEPFVALWSRTAPVTLFGAFGPCREGYDDLMRTFRWVASRWRDGDFECEEIAVHVGAETAYTVGYERGLHLSIDGGEPAEVTIRLTQAYRREEGGWKLVHRHGDFLPADESAGKV